MRLFLFLGLLLLSTVGRRIEAYEDPVAPTAEAEQDVTESVALNEDVAPEEPLPPITADGAMETTSLGGPQVVVAPIQQGAGGGLVNVVVDEGDGVLPPAQPYSQEPDAPVTKLDLALDAVKQDIIEKSKKIADESQWIAEVKKIIDVYLLKIRRVSYDIYSLRHEVKELYRRKKQIENLILQGKIQKKLEDAHDDLQTLTDALHNVDTKRHDISESKGTIQGTIQSLEQQLAKLRGAPEGQQDVPATGAEGGAEAGAEGGAEAGAEGAEGAGEGNPEDLAAGDENLALSGSENDLSNSMGLLNESEKLKRLLNGR
jgi:hypothetical protein